MGKPESQVRRIRKHVHQAELMLSAANLHHPISGYRKVIQILGRKQKWDWVRGAAGCARHEERAELMFEAPFHPFSACKQGSRNGGRPPAQHMLIRDQYKSPRPLRVLRSV